MCTDKQWSFLQSLGYDGEKPKNIADASELIDKFAGKKSVSLDSIGKSILTPKEVNDVEIQTKRLMEIRTIIARVSGKSGVELGQLLNLVVGQL